MDYIILNGTNSNSINGLLIQNLPPISKPKIRTRVDEIDGRDGDIVTKLGYSAYDREVLVGLHKNFDVNEVISYFDADGTVVFSDEPDKYYCFSILEQIDFERLLRFRTAKVKLHCQPFKYKYNESPIIASSSQLSSGSLTVYNSGNIISKPKITLTGTGSVNMSLNGKQILTASFDSSTTVAIDAATLNAVNPSTGALLNRLVRVYYNNLFLNPSVNNSLSWQGSLTALKVEKYNRWI